MKVLFLDIDGVCNCIKTHSMGKDNYLFPIDPEMAFRVGKIEMQTGCKIVLSSSWRHSPEAVEVVNKRVRPIYDVTPTDGETRGDEVKAWLDKHPEVTKYAILDDELDFYPDQPLFKTTWAWGLTDEVMEEVIEHLGRVDV